MCTLCVHGLVERMDPQEYYEESVSMPWMLC